jgi:hypothetical protein
MDSGEAKAQLYRLIKAARMGKDVVGVKDNGPKVPVVRDEFRFGGLEHPAGAVPDFLEPASAEDLHDREGRD